MTERPLTVLVAGGSAPSGIAVARALAQAGLTVYTVGSDSTRIAAAAEAAGSGVTPLTCDLASLPAVRELHEELTGTAGRIDGVIHLVGGWRGGRRPRQGRGSGLAVRPGGPGVRLPPRPLQA